MSERGMMRVTRKGKRVDLIPFVGIKPRVMASAMSRLIGETVSYTPHQKPGGSDGVA